MSNLKINDVPEAAYELGELKEDFRFSKGGLVMCLLLVLVFGGLAAYAIWVRWPALVAPAGAKDWVWLALGPLVFVGLVGWCGYEVSKMVKNRKMRVLVFEDGFVCFRLEKVFVCRFDDVAWVREEFLQRGEGIYHQLTVRLRAGEEWVFNNGVDLLENYARLMEVIQQEVTRRLLPAAMADVRAGRTLDFGSLGVSSWGIIWGEKSLPWSEVKTVCREYYGIRIDKQGAWTTWAAIPAVDLTNNCLLMAVVTELAKEESKAPEAAATRA